VPPPWISAKQHTTCPKKQLGKIHFSIPPSGQQNPLQPLKAQKL
jgi:hypothetical protein